MKYKVDWFNLATTYLFFGLVYSGVIWLIWNFLFAPFYDLNFSFLQILGGYTIIRILFGNSNTNYVSNIYTPKNPDLDKIDDYLKDFQDQLDKEAKEVEDRYRDLDKKD
jgi:tetrahydromethanopterin S-methyltransferase subunit F